MTFEAQRNETRPKSHLATDWPTPPTHTLRRTEQLRPARATEPTADAPCAEPLGGGMVEAAQREASYANPVFSRRDLLFKRSVDVIVAALTLALVAPIFILIGALVAVTSRGPILFRQERVGMKGISFTILKFRTMQHGTYERVCNDPDLWREYIANDHKLPAHLSRTTFAGKWLRKLSLDELPQLINVLRGEMSLVGIRPIERTQLELRPIESQRLYEVFRPGLTGLWQVEGRSGVKHDGRVQLDDRYVVTWTVLFDLQLLLRTPIAVLKMRHSI